MDNEKRYDWYEEDFASFLLSLNLPAYRKDMPTKVALSSEKETFVDDSEMRLIVSTIRSVSTNGRILAEKYKKDDIVNSARKSETYNSRTEKRIDSFIQIYDRFSTDIIEIADSFDRMMGSNYSDEKTEFFFIS